MSYEITAQQTGRPQHIISRKVHLRLTFCADVVHGGVTGPDYFQICGVDLLIQLELPLGLC